MQFALGPYVASDELPGVTGWRAPAGAVPVLDLRSIPGHAQAGMALFMAESFSSDYRVFGEGHLADFRWGKGERAVFASALGLRTVEGDGLLDGLWDVLTVSSDPSGEDGPRPIMPTRRRYLELRAAGTVRRKRFDAGLTEATAVRDALQRQYRAHYEAERDGQLREKHHLRILDALCEKYGLDEGYFRPGDLPKESRLAHETTITESFNKADGALGPDLSWSHLHSTVWTVASNAAQHTSAAFGSARADSALSSDDHYAQADFASITFAQRSRGVLCRKDATGTLTYYLAVADDTNWESWKWVGGSLSAMLSDSTQAIVVGDTIAIEADGSTISRKYNGVAQVSGTDTAISGNLYCGIGSVHSNAGHSLDDFEAADLGAAPASIVPILYHHQRMQMQ